MKSICRSTSIPSVPEHIVGEGADSVEVSVGIVWIWGFCGEADGQVGEDQYGKYGPICTLLCHILTSQIMSQGVRIMKIRQGPLGRIISGEADPRK